jgi:hypothetical protein
VSHSFTVTALDPYGNRATGYLGTITLTISGGVVTPSTYQFKAGDHGSHTFTAVFTSTGADESITATDFANNFTASQNNIDVTATMAPRDLRQSTGVGGSGQPGPNSITDLVFSESVWDLLVNGANGDGTLVANVRSASSAAGSHPQLIQEPFFLGAAFESPQSGADIVAEDSSNEAIDQPTHPARLKRIVKDDLGAVRAGGKSPGAGEEAKH